MAEESSTVQHAEVPEKDLKLMAKAASYYLHGEPIEKLSVSERYDLIDIITQVEYNENFSFRIDNS